MSNYMLGVWIIKYVNAYGQVEQMTVLGHDPADITVQAEEQIKINNGGTFSICSLERAAEIDYDFRPRN